MRVPYQKPQPRDMRADMVILDGMGQQDPRVWVPLSGHVASRPLQFNVTLGQYTHVLRVTKAGVIARHRHSGGVHAWVFKGRWHYLEHDWVAETGSYVFEPPGEIHTLWVPPDTDEMITFFNITGCMYYLDENDRPSGFEDVFTKIDMCRRHYASVGLGADYLDQFIR
jgi:quercetin dioxygenase-like cupin family protein